MIPEKTLVLQHNILFYLQLEKIFVCVRSCTQDEIFGLQTAILRLAQQARDFFIGLRLVIQNCHPPPALQILQSTFSIQISINMGLQLEAYINLKFLIFHHACIYVKGKFWGLRNPISYNRRWGVCFWSSKVFTIKLFNFV